MIKIGITGGLGFIGRCLANELLINGYEVKLIDNCVDENKLMKIESIYLDRYYIRDVKLFGQMQHVLQDVDSVVHLAANPGVQFSIQNPITAFYDNSVATFNCIEAAKYNGIKNFIFASSGSVLGNAELPYDENSIPEPMSPYGSTKLTGESLCSAYSASYGMNNISFRFSNVYGPYGEHKDNLIPAAIKALVKDEDFYIYGTGEKTRDFIYVDDLIQGIMLGIEGKLDSGVYQLATGISYSVNEVIAKIQQKGMEYLKRNLKVNYAENRKGEPNEYVVNIDKIKQYGFEPQFSLDEGIDRTIDWFRRDRKLLCKGY